VSELVDWHPELRGEGGDEDMMHEAPISDVATPKAVAAHRASIRRLSPYADSPEHPIIVIPPRNGNLADGRMPAARIPLILRNLATVSMKHLDRPVHVGNQPARLGRLALAAGHDEAAELPANHQRALRL